MTHPTLSDRSPLIDLVVTRKKYELHVKVGQAVLALHLGRSLLSEMQYKQIWLHSGSEFQTRSVSGEGNLKLWEEDVAICGLVAKPKLPWCPSDGFTLNQAETRLTFLRFGYILRCILCAKMYSGRFLFVFGLCGGRYTLCLWSTTVVF